MLQIKSNHLILAFISAILSICVLFNLLTVTFDDSDYIKDLEKFRLGKDYPILYHFFEDSKFAELKTNLHNGSFHTTNWKSMKIGQRVWELENRHSPGWVIYRFDFTPPPKEKLWAFAPIVLSHTKFWVFQNGREIYSVKSWQNDKESYVFPVSSDPSSSTKKASVFVLARADKNSYALGSVFGYFYGPYDKFPRLNYQLNNINLYSRTVWLIGIILTLLLIFLVLYIPSHSKGFHNLIFYSIFFNIFSVLPYVFYNLENAVFISFLISFFQSIGLWFLGRHTLAMGRHNIFFWIVNLGVCFSYFAIQGNFTIADVYQSYIRLSFTAFLLLVAGFNLYSKSNIRSQDSKNHILYTSFLFFLLISDLIETVFFQNIFYNRYQTFHLVFFGANFFISLKIFRANEVIANQSKILDSQLVTTQKTLRMVSHDILEPFNKLVLLSNMMAKTQKVENIAELQKKISDVSQQLKIEKEYVTEILKTLDTDLQKKLEISTFEPQTIFNRDSLENLNQTNDIDTTINFNIHKFQMHSNPSIILRIVRNIVKNAISATNGNTTIFVEAQKVDNVSKIVVRNTGSRIPEGLLERLFDPYVTTGKKGKGLGLFICKSLTAKLGGTIDVRNLSDSVEFEISIPDSEA